MTPQRPGAWVAAVVLDIEGTTGSISHVHEVLFPYARKSIAGWVHANRESAAYIELTRSMAAFTRTPDLDEAAVITQLQQWADQDVKAPPLKTLQGWIWADGYASGDLSGHVYPDVPPALSQWVRQGIACHIYSSGSAQAQQDWFAHTAHGDLTGLLSGYHDLTTAGPKRETLSYQSISRAIGVGGARILFASDIVEELDAARDAGWQTVAVRRPDDERGSFVPGHRLIATFADLPLHAVAG